MQSQVIRELGELDMLATFTLDVFDFRTSVMGTGACFDVTLGRHASGDLISIRKILFIIGMKVFYVLEHREEIKSIERTEWANDILIHNLSKVHRYVACFTSHIRCQPHTDYLASVLQVLELTTLILGLSRLSGRP